ncbi:hypothetical protein [Helicobacter typhlonius]|uniref:hypothetical protein n=1 Tax=Helicobacter typhlonius TaxID=76936 RepID=UPI002FDFEB4B
MIYDFSFTNTSADEEFFLSILAKEAKTLDLEAFFYTHSEQTHCLLVDLHAFIESHKQNASSHAQLSQTQSQNKESILEQFAKDMDYSGQILSFANNLSLTLPLCLYFSFLQLNPINPPQAFFDTLDTLDSKLSLIEILTHALPLALEIPPHCDLQDANHILARCKTPKTHYYTPLQTQQILNPTSTNFAMLNPTQSPMHKALKEPSADYLSKIVARLKNGENIVFSTARGVQSLSLTPTAHTHTTIVCDIGSLKTYFRTHKAHIDILASFEKPSTRLVPKEVFEKHFPADECGLVKVTLPYDMPLAIIGALLLQDEIGYFFLSHTQGEPDFDFAHSVQQEQILSIAKNGMFIDTHIAHNLSLHSLIDAHIDVDSQYSHLVIYLSSKHPSAFLIYNQNPKVLLDISFDNNPLHICEEITRKYESGGELLKNFGAHYPQILSSLFSLENENHPTNNLIDILDTCAFVLGLPPKNIQADTATNTDKTEADKPQRADKNVLFYHAYRFVRERGPRIDYKLTREGNHIWLDYPLVVRSCISFKCAGVENEILSFGVLDSLSEFVATLVRDSLTNLAIDRVLLLGDMLANHIFLDKILEYLPKNIHLILPKNGFIDYK